MGRSAPQGLGPFVVGWAAGSFGDTRIGLSALAGLLLFAFVTALSPPSRR